MRVTAPSRTSIAGTRTRFTCSKESSPFSSGTRRRRFQQARSSAPRSTIRTRFLNFHTPDGGFADHLRARDRGEPGGFDSIDVPAGTGPPANDAVFLSTGEGERLEAKTRVATIKIGREEIALIEFELESGFEGPSPHSHDDHIDSFYVLEGEPEFEVEDEAFRLRPGSLIAAPLGVVHTFANPGPERARLLNIHAPSTGFHDRLREMS